MARYQKRSCSQHVLHFPHETHQRQTASAQMCAQVLKIVSRKESARLLVSAPLAAAVVHHLTSPINPRIAAEAANVTLNMCYEKQNVALMVQQKGAHALVPHLASSSSQLQANAAGAIQSICFQKAGRAALRDVELVPKLLSLLGSEHATVKARAIGALHNVSSDAEAIRAIRRCLAWVGVCFSTQKFSKSLPLFGWVELRWPAAHASGT